MSEIETETQGQKRRYSRLAIASAICFYAAIVLTFLVPLILNHRNSELSKFSTMVGLVCLVVASILGFFGILSIICSRSRLIGLSICLSIFLVGVFLGYLYLGSRLKYGQHSHIWVVMCKSNLDQLGVHIQIYSDEFDGRYPIPEQWCDLLEKNSEDETEWFRKKLSCIAAVRGGDKASCHYAMNPNCQPNSPNDMVLLFETKGGWNQSGGAELLTTENHKDKGCNILFNDGRVEFIKPEEIGQLNWGDKQGNR